MIKMALCNPYFKYNYLALTNSRAIISKVDIHQLISRFLLFTEEYRWTYDYLKVKNLFHLYQSYFKQIHVQKIREFKKELLGLEIPLALNNSGLRHSHKLFCLFTLIQ